MTVDILLVFLVVLVVLLMVLLIRSWEIVASLLVVALFLLLKLSTTIDTIFRDTFIFW
jgi:hypothetical protein